ncbi:MAG: phosphotransferase [Actinomycetota bacterium]
MFDPHPLPSGPAAITATWLTDVLHASGVLPASGSVASIDRQPVGEGVGMLSEIEFLHLTFDGDATGAPDSVVVKFPTANEQNRAVAEQYNVYRREVRYFAELDPQNDAPGPAVHLSAMDDDGHFVIVLENLSAYDLGDQVVGATLEQTQAGIDLLVSLHSSFWGRMTEEEHGWLPRASGSFHADNMYGGAQFGWDPMLATFGDHVTPAVRDMKDRFVATIRTLQAQLDTDPVTLAHGDFRMDNLFFAADPSHHAMTVIDWQGPLRSRGMHDVAYLLSQSTQTEVRRAHERDLIQRYVDGLAAAGIDGYGFDEAWADYRCAVLYLWCYAVVIAGTLDSANERGVAWMTEMIKRNVAAIEDLDCLQLLR